MLGFTYNGKHCEDMGVHYVPKETERGDFTGEYDVLSDERAWHDGGDYYKPRVKSRTKKLSCYYQDITRKQREEILKWLDRRTSGYLTFDERPYARYYVHPTKKLEIKEYGIGYGRDRRYAGVFTIEFTAYHPFAELMYTTRDTAPIETMDEVDLLTEDKMPSPHLSDWLDVIIHIPGEESGTYIADMLVYNPGTEVGHSIIRFEGETGTRGINIKNLTNGDVCALRPGLTTTTGEYYELSSKTGRMDRVTPNGRTLDCAFHDKGYIHFAPNRILRDGIYVTYEEGKSSIKSRYAFSEDLVGGYIYLNGAWQLLDGYTSERTMRINTTLPAANTEKTDIASMNVLDIEGGDDMRIDRMDILCIPEVR